MCPLVMSPFSHDFLITLYLQYFNTSLADIAFLDGRTSTCFYTGMYVKTELNGTPMHTKLPSIPNVSIFTAA